MALQRYARQLSLPQIGDVGQQKILASSVLIIGLGGLGLPAATYLAGAGVGKLCLVDADVVSISNLHRQVIYRECDSGLSKVEIAARHLRELNSEISVSIIQQQLLSSNVDALVSEYDIVVDCADNFATTYLLSDTCSRFNKPLVSASVLAAQGYIGVFCADSPSYRAVFPTVPDDAPNCSQSGVFGPVVGVVGLMQAQEVLKLIINPEKAIKGKLLRLDLWNNQCSYIDFSKATEVGERVVIPVISYSEIKRDDVVVDVRSVEEIDVNPIENAMSITLENMADQIEKYCSTEKRIVFCCVTGRRATRAAEKLISLNCDQSVAIVALG